jgi:hypothetical protein
MVRLALGGIVGVILTTVACNSPTAPDPRTGIVELRISSCDFTGRSPLECRAQLICNGLYPCPSLESNSRDVTEAATWNATPAAIVRVVAAGRIEAVGVGDGAVSVAYTSEGNRLQSSRTVSVFGGTAPLPTAGIGGSVSEIGKTLSTGGIQGAVVEIVNGLVAGRTATTGTTPMPVFGFSASSLAPYQYAIFGVPPGRYTVRVIAEGFVSVERSMTVTDATRWDDSGSGDFQLLRR